MHIKSKNQIEAVRNQLGLDTAVDSYLATLTANLGVPRPVRGWFSDDHWRAIAKQVALEYKQISTQFTKVLEIILGPQVTKVTALAEAVSVGDSHIVVTYDAHLPQVGTLTLDKGLAEEEVLEYDLIDRQTHTIYLKSKAVSAHSTVSAHCEVPVLAYDATRIVVPTSVALPDTAFPFSFIVGRGTSEEECVSVSAIDADTNTLTIDAPLANSHELPTPALVNSPLSAVNYTNTSTNLYVEDASKFPQSGYITVIEFADSAYNLADATATELIFDSGTFTGGNLAGYTVCFTGDVTAGLTGVTARVLGNTSDTLYLDTTLPYTPAVLDTVYIRPVVEYVDVDYASNALILRKPFAYPQLSGGYGIVELLKSTHNIAVSTVHVQGVPWDVLQVSPRQVDILLPQALFPNDLRSASYIHDVLNEGTVTTNVAEDADSSFAADVATYTGYANFAIPDIGTTSDFPVAGVLSISGSMSDLVGYYLTPHADLNPSDLDDNISFVSDTGFDAYDTIVRDYGSFIDDGFQDNQIIYVDNAADAGNNTYYVVRVVADSVLAVEQLTGLHVTDSPTNSGVTITTLDLFVFPNVSSLSDTLQTADVLTLWQPTELGNLIDGDPTGETPTLGVFPGPYVYLPYEYGANNLHATTKLDTLLGGPTLVSATQIKGHTSLEVDDALAYTALFLPTDFQVGIGSTNLETLSVTAINLKNRVNYEQYSLANNVTAGDFSFELSALTSMSTAANIPTSTGYRMILGVGTPAEETVYVTQVDTINSVVYITLACQNNHLSGAYVGLMADVLTVQETGDAHMGVLQEYTQRNVRRPKFNSEYYKQAEIVAPVHSSLNLASGTSFTQEGKIILNFGDCVPDKSTTLAASVSDGDTTLTLSNDDGIPTAPFILVIDEGKSNEERVMVTDTGASPIRTIDYPFTMPHASAAKVQYYAGKKEVLDYDSISGDTLSFTNGVVLQYTHSPGEMVSLSTGYSTPRIDGYSFPLRMPWDSTERIRFALDLVRAAGVKLNFISRK